MTSQQIRNAMDRMMSSTVVSNRASDQKLLSRAGPQGKGRELGGSGPSESPKPETLHQQSVNLINRIGLYALFTDK